MAYEVNSPLGPIHTSVTVARAVQDLGDQVPMYVIEDSSATTASLKQYNSLDDVQNDYDVDSLLYKHANAAFSGINPPQSILVLTVVPEDSYVSPVSITLDSSILTGTVGTTLKITPTVLPATTTDKTVSAVSGDTSVATISPNTDGSFSIALKAAGHATLTFKTGVNDEITTTASVSVAAPNIPVSGVTLNKTTLTGTAGGTDTLVANVAPNNATNKDVTWSSSDNSVLTVDDAGKITYLKAGTANVIAKTVDGSFTATATATVNAES